LHPCNIKCTVEAHRLYGDDDDDDDDDGDDDSKVA
jgi:hypothetical protein